METINQIKNNLKTELKTELKKRPEYLIPKSKYTKSDQSLKLIRVGSGFGFQVPKDVVYVMGLKHGMVLKVTLELCPSDATNWLENGQV